MTFKLAAQDHPIEERSKARLPVIVDRLANKHFFTEDISRVGLFVSGLTNTSTKRRNSLEIELQIPGFGWFHLNCHVVHVIDQERAEREGLHAGSGLLISSADSGYYDVMDYYLRVFEHQSKGAALLALGNNLIRRWQTGEHLEQLDELVASQALNTVEAGAASSLDS